MQSDKLIVILGPTATGKSALAVEIARACNGEIISADSRQVYTGLNLGTGKVTRKEMRGVPHHLLDVANPKKQFSVSEYAKLAKTCIAEIRARGNVPIICGGTGFYIDTTLADSPLPEVPPNIQLRKKLAPKSAESLFTLLEKLDPQRAKTIDRHNKVRLVRAIEIATALGAVPKIQKNSSQKNILKIGLDMSDELLKQRIAKRLKERMKKGMLTEAKKLHTQGLSWKRMTDLGLEYRSMAQLLTKKIDGEEFTLRLTLDIWHYAKRQRTWFKRDTDIVWFDPTKKTTETKAIRLARSFLKK